jgi:hypothetical protein
MTSGQVSVLKDRPVEQGQELRAEAGVDVAIRLKFETQRQLALPRLDPSAPSNQEGTESAIMTTGAVRTGRAGGRAIAGKSAAMISSRSRLGSGGRPARSLLALVEDSESDSFIRQQAENRAHPAHSAGVKDDSPTGGVDAGSPADTIAPDILGLHRWSLHLVD